MCSCPRSVGALWLTNIDAVFDLCLRGRLVLLECMWSCLSLVWINKRKDYNWDVEAWDELWFQHEFHRFLEADKEHMSVSLQASYSLSLLLILRIYLSECMCVCVSVNQTAGETIQCVSLIRTSLGGKKTYGPSILFFPLYSFSLSCLFFSLLFISPFYHSLGLVSEESHVRCLRERDVWQKQQKERVSRRKR